MADYVDEDLYYDDASYGYSFDSSNDFW
jgi:hypothetical protein